MSQPSETLITVDDVLLYCPRCRAAQQGVVYWHGDEDYVIATLEPALMHRCPIEPKPADVEEPRPIVDLPLPW